MLDRYSEETYPLSSMQQGMLFHTVSEPSSGVYVQQKILKLSEALDIDAFEEAWQRVFDRHSILRTRFHFDDQQGPVQVVCPSVKVTLQQQDWRSLTEAEQQQRREAFLLADRRQGFDFEAGPPIRLMLFQLSDAVYELIWTSHHALLDGRSYVLILTELFQVYEALCAGQDLQLQEPRPYREFVDWLSKQDWNEAERYWRDALQGIVAPTPLVVDTERSPDPDAEVFCKQELKLTRSATTQLRSVAEANDFTVNNVLQGAWAMLMSRYSSEQDVLFGTTRAGRSALPAGQERVGLFINTVPFRVNVAPEISVVEFLEGLRRQHLALREYEQTPLSMIQPLSQIPRPLPLFESALIFENFLVNTALRSQGDGWGHREFQLEERTHFALTVGAYLDERLLLKIGYDTRRFDEATISRMLGHLQTLIEGMTTDLEAPLKNIPLLTKRERDQLLLEWNQTEAEYPREVPLADLIEQQVARTPDAVAIVFGDQSITYSELNQRANRLARELRKNRIGPDSLVAIYLERSIDMMVALLATVKAGSGYLPLDPYHPPKRIRHMMGDSGATVVLTQKKLRPSLHEHQAAVIEVDDPGWYSISPDNLGVAVNPGDLGYLIYTSGSTGKPKGVEVSRGALANLLWSVREWLQFHGGDRLLAVTTISFDIAAADIWLPWLVGAQTVLASREQAADGAELKKLIEHHDITFLQATPVTWRLLLYAGWQGKKNMQIVCTGEAMPSELATALTPLVGRVWNLYGPTETTIWSTGCVVQRGEGKVLIGRPIANTQCYILDDHRHPVPQGVIGELYLAGDGVARGYLNRPELTSEKFLPNPFDSRPGARMYRTGDLARYHGDGSIECLGRMDHQVKIRGFRIELGEIETLLNDRQDVRQSVVIVREDVPGDKRLVAYLVPQDNTALDVEGLRRNLSDQLPSYMIPTAYVTLDTLPLTPNGKIDRRALPPPVASQSQMDREIVAARDEFESELVRVWEDLLDRRPISIHDNFFDLGGDSLLAMRLLIKIKKRFRQNFPDMSIYEAPTVAALAIVLRGSQGQARTESSVIVPIKVNGHRPPFFLAGLAAGRLVRNLADHLAPDRPFYAILTKQLGDEVYYGDTVPTASRLIEEIKSVQPHGPYFLGTFCNQGSVVFELAQQLLAQGERVGALAMIEAVAPGRRGFSYRIRRSVYRDYYRAKTVFQTMKRLTLTENLSYILELGNNFLKRRMKSINRIARRLIYRGCRWLGRPIHRELLESKAVSATLYQHYIPKKYPGRILVFVGRMAHFLHDRTLGWNELASGAIEVHVTPGNHTNMLREPNVLHLGRCLETCLQSAEAECANVLDAADTDSDASQFAASSSHIESGNAVK